MSQEPLERSEEAIEAARAAAAEAPVSPFGGTEGGVPAEPEQGGGSVGEHGFGEDIDSGPDDPTSGSRPPQDEEGAVGHA